MRVFLTGATGFLGYYLCKRLLADGHAVTAYHRPGSQTARIEALGARLACGELTDLTALRAAAAGHDAAIHAAADIQYSSPQPALQEKVNVDGARNAAQACRLEGVAKFVHVSSVSAIGILENPRQPADETFPFNLLNAPLPYHHSKMRAEEAVGREIALGLHAVIVNPASIFGPHGNAYRGGDFMAKAVRAKAIPYFTGGMCAVHVDDVVSGTLAALERGVSGDRYILGGDNLTYRDIASRALAAFQLRRPLLPVPPALTALLAWTGSARFTPAVHYCSSRFQYYSSAKAGTSLGYTPKNFDAILSEWAVFHRTVR